MATTILVMWEQVPDETILYLLEDLNDEEAELVKQANGKYIELGGDVSDGIEFLNLALTSRKEDGSINNWCKDWIANSKFDESVFGKFANCNLPLTLPDLSTTKIDTIIVAGIYL